MKGVGVRVTRDPDAPETGRPWVEDWTRNLTQKDLTDS